VIELLLSIGCVAFLVGRRTPGLEQRLLRPNDRRIRCPRCGWEPQKHDRWFCDPGCHCRWNTFDTAGVCPECAKQWDQTACLSCHQWSPHAEWYEPGE
jgi:hypothetical protein